jgi:hypothetical protein
LKAGRREEEMREVAAAAAAKGTVVLAVNGKRYEAAGVDPSTTLLEFLRTQTPVRGPKLGCGEGTCARQDWLINMCASSKNNMLKRFVASFFLLLESCHLASQKHSLIPQTTVLFSSILKRLVWPGNSSSCMNTLRFYGVEFPKKKTSGRIKRTRLDSFRRNFLLIRNSKGC